MKVEYEKLAVEMLRRHRAGNGFRFYHYMLDLTGGPCVYKRISGCGSGTEYMAVTPWGDLYPCHQFVGNEGFCLGNVWDGVTTPSCGRVPQLQRLCPAGVRRLLGQAVLLRGCAANAYHATGSIRGVYETGCELFRKRMECAIMLPGSHAAG